MSPLSMPRLGVLFSSQECVFASVHMCAGFDEMALPHRVDILTETGRGQSEESSVKNPMYH